MANVVITNNPRVLSPVTGRNHRTTNLMVGSVKEALQAIPDRSTVYIATSFQLASEVCQKMREKQLRVLEVDGPAKIGDILIWPITPAECFHTVL